MLIHQKELDVVKLVPVPVDLSKLNDVVKNDVVNPSLGWGGGGGKITTPKPLCNNEFLQHLVIFY